MGRSRNTDILSFASDDKPHVLWQECIRQLYKFICPARFYSLPTGIHQTV